MDIYELREAWEEDSPLDLLDLAEAAASVPQLHAKYLNYLSDARLMLRRKIANQLRLQRAKESYYMGTMTRDELQEWGWDPYQLSKPTKTDLAKILTLDEDMIKSEDKVDYWRTVVGFLESVMKAIGQRSWDVRNAIEWKRLTMGG